MSQSIRVQVNTGLQGATGATGPAGATGGTGGTGGTGSGGGGGGGVTNAGFSVAEEFFSPAPVADGTAGTGTEAWWYGGPLGLWITRNSGASTQSLGGGTTGHPGALTLVTGTSSSGFAAVAQGNTDSVPQGIILGGGQFTYEAVVGSDDVVSDGTNSYILKTGMMDVADDTNPHGIWFDVIDGVNSRKWVARTRNFGGNDSINSSVSGPSSGGWAKLKFVVNAAGTSVEFFINGVSIGSLTTNIFTSGYMGAMTGIFKRAGSSSRTMNVDYMSLAQTLTTPR